MAADVLARYHRLKGNDVFLQVGIDEHSLNVVKKAKSLELSPREYCDQMAEVYQEFFHDIGVDYQCFIRTSDSDHEQVVLDVLFKLAKKGLIYPGKYEGWYCPSCETFYRERDLIDGRCPVHDFLEPNWICEYNYYFRLSAFRKQILRFLRSNPSWIVPKSRYNAVLQRIKDGLEDISISRGVLDWGIKIPIEILDYVDPLEIELEKVELVEHLKNQKVYIWFDALLNYVTAAGYEKSNFYQLWPANLQLIGKDIIWFHAVIQFAVLSALDLQLPVKIFAHGFITLEGKKISSSRGNLLYPKEVIKDFGIDPLRYYFFRRISFGQDGDFSWGDFLEIYNSSLANVLGNLVHRSIKMTEKYFGGVIPELGKLDDVDLSLLNYSKETITFVEESFARLELSKGLIKIEEFLRRVNRYIDETMPWKIGDERRLATVIFCLLHAIYLGTILLKPFIPDTVIKIMNQLGQDQEVCWPEADRYIKSGRKVQSVEPLFPRLDININLLKRGGKDE